MRLTYSSSRPSRHFPAPRRPSAEATLVALPDGSEFIRNSASGDADEAEAVGVQLARQLLESGARRLLDEASAGNG